MGRSRSPKHKKRHKSDRRRSRSRSGDRHRRPRSRSAERHRHRDRDDSRHRRRSRSQERPARRRDERQRSVSSSDSDRESSRTRKRAGTAPTAAAPRASSPTAASAAAASSASASAGAGLVEATDPAVAAAASAAAALARKLATSSSSSSMTPAPMAAAAAAAATTTTTTSPTPTQRPKLPLEANASLEGGSAGAPVAIAAEESSFVAAAASEEESSDGHALRLWEAVLRNVYDAGVPRPPIYYEELELEVGGECSRLCPGRVVDAKCDHSGPYATPDPTPLQAPAEPTVKKEEEEEEEGAEKEGVIPLPSSPTRTSFGSLRVLLRDRASAEACAALMHGRWFDERRLCAHVVREGDEPPPMPATPLTPATTASTAPGPAPAAEPPAAAATPLAVGSASLPGPTAVAPPAPPPPPPPPPPPVVSAAVPAAVKPVDKLGRALKALEAKLVSAPNDKDLHANRSGVLGLMGQWGEALSAAEEAIAVEEFGQVDSSKAKTLPKGGGNGVQAKGWGWGLYRKAAAHLELKQYLEAVAASRACQAKDGGSNGKFKALAASCVQAAREHLDPLDLISLDMELAAAKDLEASNAKEALRAAAMKGVKIDIDEGHVDLGFQFNPAAHCYVCKQRGHTKVDCPMRKCDYCFVAGHKRSDCPQLTEDLNAKREDDKGKKRQGEYDSKRAKRKEEWEEHLRSKTGMEGHGPLYEILGLPAGKPATEAEVKACYKKLALKYHPDKNRDALDPEAVQQKFMEVKAAYDLLLEGLRTGQALSDAQVAAVAGVKAVKNHAVNAAVQAALSAVPKAYGADDLSRRAKELGKTAAASSAAAAASAGPGPKRYSETDG